MVVQVVYAGPIEDGEKALAPLRAFGPPAADLVAPITYPELQASGPSFPGFQNYWTADFMTGLPDEAIEVLAAAGTRPVSPMSPIIVVPGGDAVSRVSDDETAFGERRAPFNIHYLSSWPNPADNADNIARTKEISQSMKPWTTGRVYLNYIGDEGQGRIESSFGPEKLARLRVLKAKWDPHNLFRHNQNIRPAAAAE